MASKKLTYAQVADKLTKKIGKLEEKIKQGGRYKAGDERMLSVLNQKKEQLFEHQEQMKKDAYQKENTALMNKYGMNEQVTASQSHQMPDGSMMPGAQHQYRNGGYSPQYYEMAYGGNIPQYGTGARIAQGVGQGMQIAGSLVGNVPGVGTALGAGLGGLGAGLELAGTGADPKEFLTDMAFGAAKGATGTLGSMAIGAAEELYDQNNNSASEQKALYDSRYTSSYANNQAKQAQQKGYIDAAGQVASMFVGAYGGRVPSYAPGGVPPNGNNPPTIEDIQRQYPQFTPEEHQSLLKTAFTKYNDVQNRRRLAGQDYGEQSYYNGEQNPNITGNEVYPNIASNQPQNNPTKFNQSQSRESSVAGNYNQAESDVYSKYNNGDYTIKDDPQGGNLYYSDPSANAPKAEAGPYDNYTSSPDFDPNGGNKSGSRFGDYATMAGKYAPTIYNTIKGFQKPEQTNKGAYYNPYEQESMDLMRGRRYNIDPELEANNRSYNAMKGSIGQAAGGDSSSYLATLGSSLGNKQRADARAYAMKQNMDNQYIGQEAQALTGFGQGRAQADMYTDDINAQARARQGDYQAAAATGLSQATFNEERNRNLTNADMIRANTLQGMYGDYGYSQDDKGKLTGSTYYRGNRV